MRAQSAIYSELAERFSERRHRHGLCMIASAERSSRAAHQRSRPQLGPNTYCDLPTWHQDLCYCSRICPEITVSWDSWPAPDTSDADG